MLRYGSLFLAVFGVLMISSVWGPPPASAPHPPSTSGKVFFTCVFLGYVIFVLARLFPAGAYPRPEGLLVRNLFRTELVPWDEIQGFSLKHWGWRWNYGDMGHVERTDGTSLHIAAIQVPNIGGGAARRAVDELNAMLRERRGGDPPPAAPPTPH